MIWTLLLFINLVFAEDLAIERYCFPSSQKMSDVAQRLQIILVPSDKIERDGNCFSVSMRPHRRELIQSYTRNLDPQVQISFSSAQTRTEHCKLKVEKVKSLDKNQMDANISGASNVLSTQTTRETKETTSIQTLKNFEMTINQDVIKGECRFITPIRYEISLEVRKDPKPLMPGLPAGSIVILTHPVTPPDQETSLLKTTLQLAQGQRIEIGSVVRDLREKQHKVDASSPQLEAKKVDGEEREKVFLSLE